MFYKYLKEKQKINIREENHYDRYFNSLMNMFSYKCSIKLPFSFFYNLEGYLINDGECAVIKDGESLTVWKTKRVGDLDDYGKGVDLLCTSRNGKSKTFKNFLENPSVVYCKNTYTSTGDLELERYSSFMAEIDKSILHNVINCRVSPIIEASDQQEKNEIDNAIKNNESGKPTTIITKRDPLAETEKGLNVVSYTDVANIDKIQYLTQTRECVDKWFFNIYGLATTASTKLAQMSVDEVNQAENISRIMPDVKLEMRKLFCEEIKEKFGIEITVSFNDAWSVERGEQVGQSGNELDDTGQMDDAGEMEESEGADNDETMGNDSVDGVVNDVPSEGILAELEEIKNDIEDIEEYMNIVEGGKVASDEG